MAQINPAAYPSRYKISHADYDGTTSLGIEFSDDIASLLLAGNLSMDSYMDGSNSYCGYDASQGGYFGGAQYGITIGNPNDPATERVQYGSKPVENSKQNIRWFLKITRNQNAPQGGSLLRWTPQVDGAALSPIYNRSNRQRLIAVMTDTEVSVQEGGVYSLLYDLYPITKINLDKIQLIPHFTVIRYAPTYTGDVITSVTSSTTRYYWNDIKPADKTPAGANYNQDLWEKGFYDVMREDDNSKIKYRYVLDSCSVKACYYSGKYTASGSGIIESTPIDGSNWNFDEDRRLPTTGFDVNYGFLVPYSEGVFNVEDTEGVMLNPISGLCFTNVDTILSRNIDFITSYTGTHYTTVTGIGSTMIPPYGSNGTGFLLRNTNDRIKESYVLISQAFGFYLGASVVPEYTQTKYEFLSDGSITHKVRSSSTRSQISLQTAPFSLEALWIALASLGVYVVGVGSIPASEDFVLGVNFPTWLYHGEVLEDGTTTGTMIQGDDIEALPPWDEIDYTPVKPTPGPPGPPEGEESGDRIPNNERYFSGAYNFVTQYAMTRQQLGQFGNLLWSSWADQQGITDMWKNFKMFISADPASDTGSIDIASIMDFILSLQVFPFDLSSLLHTDSTNVCIGTGQYPLAVSGKKLLTINHILDCGTMAIPRPYNDFRDYENMSITAYLPYCGSVELNPGDVVGRSVSIEYSVDTLSGSCTAVLTAYDDSGYLYNVGMINGQISASIPMTATNSGQIRAQRISDVASLAGLAGNTFLGNISQGAQVASGADSNPIGAISSAVYGTVGRSLNAGLSAQQMFANRFSRGAISCPTLAGGNGIAAFFQPACPYIQMRYGLYQKPDNYDHSVGGVSATSAPLSSYAGSGFTVCENVDISGFTCHEEERSAIKALLESGVYL